MPLPAKESTAEPDFTLTSESREMLRQLLRVSVLPSDAALIDAVKGALHKHYSRGFQEGMVEGSRAAGTPASSIGEQRSLSASGHTTLSSRERRQRRRARRLRHRIRNALTTVVVLVLAGAAVLAVSAARPEMSANNPRARHRIEFGGK